MNDEPIEIYIDYGRRGFGGMGNAWVLPLGDDRFQLAENPLCAKGLSLGDVVALRPMPDDVPDNGQDRSRCYQFVQRVAKSRLRRSDHMASRESRVYADWGAFDQTVRAAGGEWERVMGGIVILNLPRGAAFDLGRTWEALHTSATAAEKALMAALRRDVGFLAEAIGERHLGRPSALRRAAGWLAGELAATGLAVGRQRFEVDGRDVENIEAVLPGTTQSDEIVVVGAHYDTVRGTPGADDNASGVAAMLAIARSLAGRPRARTVRFVGFVNEEPPYFHTETMGSLVYARACKAHDENVVGMLSLESLGFYRDEPGSQAFPDPVMAARFGDKGDFVSLVADEASAKLLKVLLGAFSRASANMVKPQSFVGDAKGVSWSDHWSFWQVGFPAVMATDTAPFRNPHYHADTDLTDTLDFKRLAAATKGLQGAIEALADGPEPTKIG